MIKIRLWASVCPALAALVCGVVVAEPQEKPEAGKAKADVAAYIGGEPVSLSEVDKIALGQDMKLAQSIYDARRSALDRIVMERLLGSAAAEKGVDVEQLIRERVAGMTKPVTDEDIQAFYDANKNRMRGQSFEQMSGRIRAHLVSQRESQAREQLLDQLKKEKEVRITLEPPRVEVPVADNDPQEGPADAKVTIVEFSDFQ